jgi:hypothetical protein
MVAEEVSKSERVRVEVGRRRRRWRRRRRVGRESMVRVGGIVEGVGRREGRDVGGEWIG